jgi:hypothetical protein
MKRLFTLFVILFAIVGASAQSTEFNYQGKLNDNSLPANANYDFEFRLYPSDGGGVAVIASQQKLNVPVSNGIFTV